MIANTVHRTARLTLCLLITLIPFGLSADEVILRDGRSLSGTIVRQTSSILILRLASGEEIEIPKRTIDRMRFAAPGESADDNATAPVQEDQLEREARRRVLENQAAAEDARRLAEERRAAAEEARRLAEEARRLREEEQRAALQAKAEAPQARAVTRGSILWRAALLPGWGQIHANEDRWGWTYALGFWISAATGVYYQDRADAFAKDRNEAATFGSDSARRIRLVLDTAFLSSNQNSLTAGRLGAHLFIQSSLLRFEQTSTDYEHLRRNEQGAFAAAAAIYIIQLIHATFMDLPAPHQPGALSPGRPEFFIGSSAPDCLSQTCTAPDAASAAVVGVRLRF